MITMSSGHSSAYLTDSVGAGREGYYTGAVGPGEPPGRWQGRGAAALGLAGTVDADVMEALFGQFRDPRDPAFADPETRLRAGVLGRAPKQFRSPEQVVEDRIRSYTRDHVSAPTPEQIQAWRIEAERRAPNAVMFHDVTYSPQKSVTVLHTAFERAAVEARTAGRHEDADQWQQLAEHIDQAVAAANDEAIAYLAEHGGYSRSGRHGAAGAAGVWEDAHDLVVASFYQHTSRSHDPQLHVHNAVLNRVECGDEKWRALDSKAMRAAMHGAGAVASARLAGELTQRLGVTWELREDGHDFEIASIDQSVMDLFSSRRETVTRRAQELIEAAETRYGRPLTSLERTRLHQQASLGTRAAKTHDSLSREEMLDAWNAQLQATLAGSLGRVAEQHRDLPAPVPEQFSPDAVIATALEDCHDAQGRPTYNRHELLRRIHLATPANVAADPDQRRAVLESMLERALAQAGVIQTSGREIGDVYEAGRLANGQARTIGPAAVRYATEGHLAAEIAVLNAAGRRGAACLDRATAEAWISDHAAELSPAQREAVLGLAASDAQLAVLIGAAGTGKSYTVGALDALWRDLTTQLPPPSTADAPATGAAPVPGRVIALTVTEVATSVLRDDGVADTANLAAFFAAQHRLTAGVAGLADERWRVGPRDIVFVDEASMVDTRRLAALQELVGSSGARMVLTGDPHQLGAVGAGGMMRAVVDRDAETYTLSDVRRFEAPWERQASLDLRDGDEHAVQDYDAHGRLRDAGTAGKAIAVLAEAAAADRLGGRSTLVVTATNEQASEVSAAIRRHLVDAGLVEEGGIVLGRDGNTAGIGDHVQARRIDRSLGLTNRETYQVTAIREDGGLDVRDTRTGQVLVMPAEYLAADAALGYASTAHAAQGATVDSGHLLLTGQLDRAGAYVGMTRGRQSNTVWGVTDSGIPDQPPQSCRGALASVLEDTVDIDPDAAAIDVHAADEARRRSAETLLGLIEEERRTLSEMRLAEDLDQLQAEGVIAAEERARFVSDQGSAHLARLLRSYEQAGHDPQQVLRSAISRRSLTDTHSVAQTVAYRIRPDGLLPAPTRYTGPERGPADRAGYLDQLDRLLQDRRDELGRRAADEQPAWAIAALGPLPLLEAEPLEDVETAGSGNGVVGEPTRAEWEHRAGIIAAYREATGWHHESLPIGRCPGVHTPEKRLAWHEAYAAADEPEERRPEAEMTTGRLLVRARAADRARAAAPDAVYDAQREAHQAADDARRAAVLAEAQGQAQERLRLVAEAERNAALAAELDRQAEARGTHLAYYAETLNAGEAADEELRRRGVGRGQEPDRTTAEEWLAAEQQARAEDDAHRTITEADLATEHNDADDEHLENDALDDDKTEAAQELAPGKSTTGSDQDVVDEHVSTPSPHAQAVEAEATTAAAEAAFDDLEDHRSADAATERADEWVDDVGPDYEPAPDTSAGLVRETAGSSSESGSDAGAGEGSEVSW